MQVGKLYVTGNMSADSIIDRTPFYEGDALAEIMKIKGINGEVDHDSLPEFARKKVQVTRDKIGKDGKIVTKKVRHTVEKEVPDFEDVEIDGVVKQKLVYNKVTEEVEDKIPQSEIVEEDGRDLGAMISILTVAVQQLNNKVKELEEKLGKKVSLQMIT